MLLKDNRTLCFVVGTAAASAAVLYVLLGPASSRVKKRRRGGLQPPGLVNPDGRCFANAILQALAPCRSVRQWLADYLGNTRQPCRLASSLNAALNVLNNEGEDSHEDTYCAADVVQSLKHHGWHIPPQDEHDAHELFHVLTQSLGEEMQQEEDMLSLFEAHKMLNAPVNLCGKSRYELAVPSRKQKLQSPFMGTLTHQTQCQQCGHKNPVQHDVIESLSLQIPSVCGKDLGLYQMLGQAMSREIVNLRCKTCGPEAPYSKQLTFGRLPKCLCLHIARTAWLNNGVAYKRREHVRFPEVLHMSAYVYQSLLVEKGAGDAARGLLGGQKTQEHGQLHVPSKSSSAPLHMLQVLNNGGPLSTTQQQHSEPITAYPLSVSSASSLSEMTTNQRHTYKLSAVVVHLGDVHSGHFITYRRIPFVLSALAFVGGSTNGMDNRFPQQWVYCSDSVVEPVSLAQVLAADAYMLYYERLLQ